MKKLRTLLHVIMLLLLTAAAKAEFQEQYFRPGLHYRLVAYKQHHHQNLWVIMGQDGSTVITNHPEMSKVDKLGATFIVTHDTGKASVSIHPMNEIVKADTIGEWLKRCPVVIADALNTPAGEAWKEPMIHPRPRLRPSPGEEPQIVTSFIF